MGKNLKDLLLEFGKKTGLDTDQEFGAIINASMLKDVEVPDSAFNSLGSLMTEKEAVVFGKNDPTVKNHHIGLFASGFEESIIDKAKSLGIPAEKLAEINGIKQTGVKISTIMDSLGELISEAAKKGGKVNTDEYTRQIQELQNQIKGFPAELEKKVGETRQAYLTRLEEMAYQSQMNFEWNNVPEIARKPAYKAAIQKTADQMGAILKYNEETNSFDVFQKANPDLKIIKDGKEIGFQDIHVLSLQNENLIKPKSSGGNDDKAGNHKFSPDPRGEGTKLNSLQQTVLDNLNKVVKGADPLD